MALKLSHEDEYEGGDLQFFTGPEPMDAPRKRGTLVIFPSFLIHRVTPVFSGVRQSMVSWISGPNFK